LLLYLESASVRVGHVINDKFNLHSRARTLFLELVLGLQLATVEATEPPPLSKAPHHPQNPLNRAQIAFFGCILFHAVSLNFIAAAAYIFPWLRVFCQVIECSF